jgi:uncharacterized protein (DUF302 family)
MKFSLTGLALALAATLSVTARPGLAAPVAPQTAPEAQGVQIVHSAYGIDETVNRLKADIAAKGIRFFTEIDQAQLGAGANIAIRPSRLILFGNPPLGVQFLSANRYAGLDWPVRMLVVEEADGSVTVAWTDFAFIGHRYALKDRDAQLKMASEVAASIASSVTR